MIIGQLSDEFAEANPTVVLTPDQVLNCIIRAVRFYAAYGNINSLALSDELPGADGFPPVEPDPVPIINPALPVKSLDLIDENTELTVGEWAVAEPLFKLYVELGNALHLEASRSSGIEGYGRSSSEVQNDITALHDLIPQRAFSHAIITIE